MRVLRTALIGCGAISKQMHLPVLKGHPSFELTALIDSDQARAEGLAKTFQVPQVLENTRSLSTEDIDAAVIATPPASHAAYAIDLMGKGVHVLVEKPLALTVAEAEEMVSVAERTGCSLSVGFFRRLFPSVRLLKALLDREWAGKPLSFYVAGGGVYNWAAATLSNMQKESAGGGVLMDMGPHLLDIVLALFEPPIRVAEYQDDSRGGIEADCSFDLQVSFKATSVQGHVAFSRLRDLGSFITIECESGTLEFQMTDRHTIKYRPRNLKLTDFFDTANAEVELHAGWLGMRTDEDWFSTFAAEYDDWYTSIRDAKPPVLSGASTIPVMQIVDECYHNKKQSDETWCDGGLCAYPALGLVDKNIRKILVTGASGFIGCRVAEVLRLRENCEVRAVVNNPSNASRLSRLDVEMVQADLASEADLNKFVKGCDAVIHCAVGTAYGEPRIIQKVTVTGTQKLAQAAHNEGVQRFVHLSSMAVYGSDGEVPALIPEDYQGRASKRTNFYGWTKWQAELALQNMHRKGLPVVMLRLARVFGPFGFTFVINPIQAMLQGRFGWMHDPDVTSDMVYVDNVVGACLHALIAPEANVSGKAFNISDGCGETWRNFYDFFAHFLGLDLSKCPVQPVKDSTSHSKILDMITSPMRICKASKEIITSDEFRAFGKKILKTEPIGNIPRWLLDRFQWAENAARMVVGADDTPLMYEPPVPSNSSRVRMGSLGAQLDLGKMHKELGYASIVSRDEAQRLTYDWLIFTGVFDP